MEFESDVEKCRVNFGVDVCLDLGRKQTLTFSAGFGRA